MHTLNNKKYEDPFVKYYKSITNKNQYFKEEHILKLSNSYGQTIGHIQAKHCKFTENIQILRLSDISGNTIAHTQAMYGWTTKNTTVLLWKNDKDQTVQNLIDNFKLVLN